MHSRRALPGSFVSHKHARDLVSEIDIKVTGGARLAAKVLFFRSTTALRHFWKHALNQPDRRAMACVQGLAVERIKRDGSRVLEVDPRFFCVMAFALKTKIKAGPGWMELITHESVHAGLCYAKRHAKNFWVDEGNLGEENIAYPAGKIAAAINRHMVKRSLYG